MTCGASKRHRLMISERLLGTVRVARDPNPSNPHQFFSQTLTMGYRPLSDGSYFECSYHQRRRAVRSAANAGSVATFARNSFARSGLSAMVLRAIGSERYSAGMPPGSAGPRPEFAVAVPLR